MAALSYDLKTPSSKQAIMHKRLDIWDTWLDANFSISNSVTKQREDESRGVAQGLLEALGL
jgi:hypothetical protein